VVLADGLLSRAVSLMARAAAKHAKGVEAASAERLRLIPQATGRDDSVLSGPDPSRPPREFDGTVVQRTLLAQRVGNGANSAENVDLAAAKWRVSWPAALILDARKGDHVQRLDEPGRPILRLATALSIRGRTIHPADQVS